MVFLGLFNDKKGLPRSRRGGNPDKNEDENLYLPFSVNTFTGA